MGGGSHHESLDKLSKKTLELHRALNSLIEELKTYLFQEGKITEIEEKEHG
jgi:hypothetical protein